MGFFAGFFSGFAFTSSVLYITLQIHHTKRVEQRASIREQVDQLNWLASSAGAYDRRYLPQESLSRRSRSRHAQDAQQDPASPQPAIKDTLKHRWNKKVETLARRAYESRWEDVRGAAVERWKSAMRLVKKE